MVDPRIRAIADVFDELHALVTAEPALSQFAFATAILASLAQDVRAGLPVGLVVPNDRSRNIPSRQLAQRILTVVDKAPGPLGHETPDALKTIAILHNNLARAVVYAIIADYPDLMRH